MSANVIWKQKYEKMEENEAGDVSKKEIRRLAEN
jgi:hypothetical protein